MSARPDPEDYADAVLLLVEQVPDGRVTTYGALADAVGWGGARRIGTVLAQHGGGVPWWRVVRADGSLPPSHGLEARARYRHEGTPLLASGRVDLRRAGWAPEDREAGGVP